MEIRTCRTHAVLPNESLKTLLDTYVPTLLERSVLVVTSKIISLCEGRVIAEEDVPSKRALIQESADAYLEELSLHDIQLTLKNGILIPTAGIDCSNGNGMYILYPDDIQASVCYIWNHLRSRDQLNELGVIISDSHTTPLRRGVIGIGLGWCGFKPLYNYIGKPDCFGRPLQVTQVNLVDALAVSAVFCMGEGNEQTPFAILSNVPKIEFQNHPPLEEELNNFSIPMDEDLYGPLLKSGAWIFNSHKCTSLSH